MNQVSILDDYKNKNVVLYGEEGVAKNLFSFLTKNKINTVGFCGKGNVSSKELEQLPFVSLQELKNVSTSGQEQDLLVQLAFPPSRDDYEAKTKEAMTLFQEMGMDTVKETASALGGFRFFDTLERLGLTEQEGNQRLQKFENLLQDEQSKEILKARIAYYFQPHHSNLPRLVAQSSSNCKYVLEHMTSIKKLHTTGDVPIVYYGLGGFAEMIFEVVQKELGTICPEAVSAPRVYCDKNYKNIKKFLNEAVISPEELVTKHQNSKVIILSEFYVLEIFQDLISQNFPSENIFYVSIVDCKNQYFDSELIHFHEREVFVDVGVMNGDTSVIFSKKTPYDAIYLFEPNAKSQEVSLRNLKNANITSYELFPFGLWNEETVLEFSGVGGTFSITDCKNTGEKEKIIQIPVNTMDKMLENKYVSFIKMDIEGAEMNALLGAAHLIKTHKPKLAISLYHKPEDLFDIPDFLHRLVPEYAFFLRHYSTGQHETVLYAVIPD